MKKSFNKYEKVGLPGGPNELKKFTNGFIVSERGQWDYPGQPTAVPTPSGKITTKGVEDDLLGIDNLGNTQYMTPNNEYQFEGDMVYEIPQAKKGGSKKPSKKYSRSLMAKNKLFAKNPLLKKSKSVKNKIFDPNSPYFQDGGEQEAMNAMMKARLAYANEFNNPSAQRMINIPDQPYEFDNGDTGTHYMASMDNYAVPQIQSVNGVLQIGNYGPESTEAMRFDSDEDANYFAENYKDVSPGFMEVELSDNEIEEYKRGGYIVEEINNYKKGGALLTKKVTCKKCGWTWDAADGGNDLTTCHKCGGQGLIHSQNGGYINDISIPQLTRMQPGGPVPDSTYTPIDPNFLAENPDVYSQIVNKPEVSSERQGSDIGKLRAEFREKTPMDTFLDEKKRQYLKKNKVLNKAAGVTMDNFPEDVLQNFTNEYNYKTNNYAVNKLGKKEGWNPKRRGEWVDELTPGEKDAVAESKYGSKLQPSYWSRSLAGVQELGNAAIKLLPGEQGDVLKYNIPGLTKKEQKEIRESKLGALETLAPMDIPGAAIANLVKNTGLSTGSDYKEQANALAGEKMANVSDTDAMALNPLTYAGLESLPELGVNLARGIGKGAGKLEKFVKNARDIEKISKAYNPNLTKAGFSLDMFGKPKPKIDFVGPMRAPANAVEDVLTGLRKRGTKWDQAGAKGEELLHSDMINYHGTYSGRPIVEVRMPDGTPEFFYKSSGWAGKSSKDGKTTAGMWQPFGGFSDLPTTKDWFVKDASELTVDGIKYKTKTFNINGQPKTLSAFDQLKMPEYNHTGKSLNGYELIDQGKIAVDKPGYELYYGSKAYKGMAENLDNALMQKLGFQNTDELENAFNFQNRNANVDSYTPIRKYGGTTAKYGYSVGNLIRKQKGGEEIPDWAKNQSLVKKTDPNKDDTYENVFEIFDPSGLSSWDDVSRSYSKNGLNGETLLEVIGALPVIGKIGKATSKTIKAVSRGLPLTNKQIRNINNSQKILKYSPKALKAYDVAQAYNEENNPVKKAVIKPEVTVRPKKQEGGSVSGTQGLTDAFSQRLTQMILDAKAQGIDLNVGSGYRSYEKQKKLWEQALKKYGSAAKARKWVAPPGGSFHNKGLAVDLHSSGNALGKSKNSKATEWAHANAKKYGLHFRMGHEPWHIEPIEASKSTSDKEDEHDHSTMDEFGNPQQPTSKEEYNKMVEAKNLEFELQQKELAEQERKLHDDDYSSWEPAKKEEVVDPRFAQLEAYSKIITPSIQNINQQYRANLQNQMRDGGFIMELTDAEIKKYRKGGYIIEDLD